MALGDVAGLETLRSLQARFLRAIRDGRWTDAEALQDQRFALMDILLGEVQRVPEVAGEMQAILARDAALLPQLQQARSQIVAELRELTGARKAVHAYGGAE